MQVSDATNVPLYGLYGNRFIDSEPGFIHIEDIAARGSDLDWVIKPHRHHHLFQVVCILDGEVEVQLSDDHFSLTGSWVITLPAGCIHGFHFRPASEGYVLSITDTVLAQEQQQGFGGRESLLFEGPQLLPLYAEDGLSQQFLQRIAELEVEHAHYHAARPDALALQSRLVVLTLDRLLRQQSFEDEVGQEDNGALSRFRALIEAHYREHWAVADYAAALGMSTSTLNRLCHRAVGEGPKKLINDRLMAEARRRLMYTRHSVEEIAYALGFSDYPYFARFFKTREGVTAGQYRKRAEQQRLTPQAG